MTAPAFRLAEQSYEVLGIDEVRPHPDNPRRGDIDVIARSMDRSGFYGACVVQRSTGFILAGNHRWAAARARGAGEIPVLLVDCDRDTARRIMLADNRTSDLAVYDNAALTALLKECAVEESGLAGSGWTAADLAQLLTPADEDSLLAGDGDEEEGEGAPGRFDPFDREALVEEAFAHMRAAGFPFRAIPRFRMMLELNRLRATPDARLAHSTSGLATCDTFHPSRFRVPIPNRVSVVQAWDDDRQLRYALGIALDQGVSLAGERGVFGVLNMVGNCQLATNFRPGFALLLYRRFAREGAAVLDTSAGFGGRLFAFLASDCSRYLGIDPSALQCEGNRRMADALPVEGKGWEMRQAACEDVPPEELAGRFDLALTSPPYHTKERYGDGYEAGAAAQSWRRYPTPDGWRDEFLPRMLALQFAALRPGGVNLLNVADRVRVDDRADLPLLDWAVDAGLQAGFDLKAVERFPLTDRSGLNSHHAEEMRTEPVIVMVKP